MSNPEDILESLPVNPFVKALSRPKILLKRFVVGLTKNNDIMKFIELVNIETMEITKPFLRPMEININIIPIIPISIQFITFNIKHMFDNPFIYCYHYNIFIMYSKVKL